MIRFVFRWAFRLLLLGIVLCVALLLLKDLLLRNLLEARLRMKTGFDVRIAKLELSLFAPVVRLENIVIYNPPEFGGSPMLDAAELHLEYSRKDLSLGRVHLKLARLNVRELHVVESPAGRTNLILLLDRVSPKETRGSANRPSGGYTYRGVDLLNLSVKTVRYSSLRVPRRNQEIHLGMQNEIVRDLRTKEDLTALLLKILLRAGITIYAGQPPNHPAAL